LINTIARSNGATRTRSTSVVAPTWSQASTATTPSRSIVN